MIINSDLLDTLVDIELQFKIQIEFVLPIPKSLILMTDGRWWMNYNPALMASDDIHTTDKIFTVLLDEFRAGEKYVFWWIVKHIIKVYRINGFSRIFELFDSDDIDKIIDYDGVENIEKEFELDTLIIVAIKYNNLRALEKLYYSKKHKADDIANIRSKILSYGNIDAFKWYEKQGLTLLMHNTDLRFIPRLDVAQYLYSRNPDWFRHEIFTIDDLVYYYNSVVNREVALIEWLVDKMEIDMRREIDMNRKRMFNYASDSKDISMICWLIDNYADILRSATDDELNSMLKSTVAMMRGIHNLNLHQAFEMFVDKIYPAGKLIDISSLGRLSVLSHTNMVSFLINRNRATGFTAYDTSMLATQNKVDELKYIHDVDPSTITVDTFACIVKYNDREVISWVIGCLDLEDQSVKSAFTNKIIHLLDSSINTDIKWWLYSYLKQRDISAMNNGAAVYHLMRIPECRFLDSMGMVNYASITSVSSKTLELIICNHLNNNNFAILRNMRDANPTIFDRCLNYANIEKHTIHRSFYISRLVWLAYNCGHMVAKPSKLINHNLENRLILQKIYADQNSIPFKTLYAELATIA